MQSCGMAFTLKPTVTVSFGCVYVAFASLIEKILIHLQFCKLYDHLWKNMQCNKTVRVNTCKDVHVKNNMKTCSISHVRFM